MNDASEALDPNAVLATQRVIPASAPEVFAAFERPERLAQWWGPNGFTNTFEQFEFKPGGRWKFVMHGPNGTDYLNESVFRQIERNAKIVIEHVVEPWFTLTVRLSPRDEGTHLTWEQQFKDAQVAARVSAVCKPANEQNLDRLEALLATRSAGAER